MGNITIKFYLELRYGETCLHKHNQIHTCTYQYSLLIPRKTAQSTRFKYGLE